MKLKGNGEKTFKIFEDIKGMYQEMEEKESLLNTLWEKNDWIKAFQAYKDKKSTRQVERFIEEIGGNESSE